MKKRKILIVVSMLILSTILLVACGAETTPEVVEGQTESASAQEEVTATEVPTEVPTEEPTEAPTEESTLEPTEEPTEEPAVSEEPVVASVSFSADVLPIINSRCMNCHGGRNIEAGLNLRTYEDIMAGSENGPVIIPGDGEGSLLIEVIVKQLMPKKGPLLTPVQIQTISDWVAAGAPNN